ncbi:hypothetical protein HPB50_003116 [Hyalomma asiaticum]|uniref:Uncharacterized protein n=1 Tax=Hyalomma asiaticum TaxID=266040 RepID=A0ACB7SA37_HYAAI|nr:hypothetical protein HPB50_003116 [Hyalomma asiaticum]
MLPGDPIGGRHRTGRQLRSLRVATYQRRDVVAAVVGVASPGGHNGGAGRGVTLCPARRGRRSASSSRSAVRCSGETKGVGGKVGLPSGFVCG